MTVYLVTWTVLGKRNALITADRSAHEHAKDIAGFEGVTDVGVQEFDSIDLSRVGVPAEEHDLLMAAKNAQIAALGARPRVCVVGLITDPADRLLLIKNRKRSRAGNGGWELPGGKHDRGETWRDALRREMREETGLDVVVTDRSPEVLDGVPVGGAGYYSVILVAHCHAEGEPVPGDDAEDARWFTRDEIPWDDLSRIGSAEVVGEWAWDTNQNEADADALRVMERCRSGEHRKGGEYSGNACADCGVDFGDLPDKDEEVAHEAKAARARFFGVSRDSEKAWQEVVRPYVQERRADHARLFALEDDARGNAAPCPSVLPVATDYTSTQLATAVDEAHDALHEAEAALNGSSTAWGTANIRGRIAVAHEALHRVGAGQPRADVPPSGHVSADRSRVEP